MKMASSSAQRFPLIFLLAGMSSLLATEAAYSLLLKSGGLASCHDLSYAGGRFKNEAGELADELLSFRYMGRKGNMGDSMSLFTRDGQILAGTFKAWSRRKGLTWVLPGGEELKIAVDEVTAIVLSGTPKVLDIGDAPKTLLKNGKEVDGEVSYLTSSTLALKTAVGKVRLKTEALRMIQVQAAAVTSDDRQELTTAEGHLLRGELISMDSTRCVFKTEHHQFELKSQSIVAFKNRGVAGLSEDFDLKQTAYLTIVDEPQWGVNPQGELLQVGGCPVGVALSLHSRSECTWQLERPVSHLSFLLDMDRHYAYLGPCELILRSGNLEKSWSLSSSSQERWVHLPLAGAKSFSLTLDYGDKGASGDRVVIADPIVVYKGHQ
jgi:hypothetical protein